MLPKKYTMDTAHRHPVTGQWMDSYGHQRDYRDHVEICGPESDEGCYSQRENQWNQGAYRPPDHNLYSGAHPRGYEWSQQRDVPNGNHQDYRTMQNSAAHWNNVSGPYRQKAPNVTVHCTGQMSDTHQPCCSSHSFIQGRHYATANSQQFTWKWHCFSNDRFTEHSQGHSRAQSRGHFRGQRLNVKGCSGRGTKRTVRRNVSSNQSLASRSQEVNTVQEGSTPGMVAALLQEHQSAPQSVDMVRRDMVPHFNKSNTADHPKCQELSSGTVSGCTVSQQIGSSSQSFATDHHGRPGHCVSASALTQHNTYSLPVNAVTDSTSIEPLDLSPVEETLPGKEIAPITIKAITKWLEKRIDMILTPKDGYNLKTQNSNQAFAVEKIDVLQPGRSSKGSRDEDSTPLCVEIQSTSRCMVVKAVPIVPPPVAVVPPLEPQATSEPTEARVKVQSSEQVSVADKLGWNSESAVKRLLSLVKGASENCDSSNAEGRRIAGERVHTEENDTSGKRGNAFSYSSRISHGKEVIKHPVETKKRVVDISSLPVSQYTLSELRKLITELESLIIPENNKDNLIDTLLNCFWGGNIQNLLRFSIRDLVKEIGDTFPFIARDEDAVVLRAVDGVHVEELLDKCVSLPPEELKSSWLNINDNVDDIDAELGVAWSQCLMSNKEVIVIKSSKDETKTMEDPETGGVETEKKTQMYTPTEIATEVEPEVLGDFEAGVGRNTETKTVTGVEIHAETEAETEAVPQGNSHSETERVDLLPASPTVLNKDPYFNPLCAVKITCLKTMDAKKLFDQLQENASGHIDLETLLSESKDVEMLWPGEEQIMNHGDQNTPDPLSVTEEPAGLGTGTEPSSGYPHLIQTSDGSGLLFHSKCLTEGSSELQGGGHQIIPVVECFSLSDLVTISDQEETEEEIITESKLQTIAQDLNTDWTEPLSPDEPVTDPDDEFDVIALSNISVCIDQEETEEVKMEPNDEPEHQTSPLDSHERHNQPSSPSHLTTSVTNEPDANVMKLWSEEKDQDCVNGQCSTSSPPLEEFESIGAFLLAKSGGTPDSGHGVSLPCHGNAESHNTHRLKRPKTSWSRRLFSESDAEDSQCMDSAVCVPQSRRSPASTFTDKSSCRPKMRRHLTKCNVEDNLNKNKISKSSEAEDCEREDTTPNALLPLNYISKSNSVNQLVDKTSAIQVSVTGRTRSKTSHTARLSSNNTCKWDQSSTTHSEDSSNDSTVSQCNLVDCHGKHSCTSPLPCAGVQCLIVCGSLTSTAPLQLRRTSSRQKMTAIAKTTERSLTLNIKNNKKNQMEAQVLSTKPGPHNPTLFKEGPHSDQTSHVKMQSHTKSRAGKIVRRETRNEITSPDPNSPLKKDRGKEKRKQEKSDESNFYTPEFSPKSPLWVTGKQSEERRYTPKSPRNNSPMQRKEGTTKEGKKHKEIDHSLQKNKHIPGSQSTGVKVKFHRNKCGQFAKKKPLCNPHSPVEMKKRREDTTVVQKSSCHDYPTRKKERTEKKDKREDTNGDKKAPAPDKVQHKTETNLQSTSFGPQVRISRFQVHPSTSKVAPITSKGPERSIGSVRRQILSHWESSYYPTPAQKRRRSGPNEEDQASPTSSPEKKSISPTQEREGGSVKKGQQSVSRRVGRAETSPYVKQRRKSQEHATLLMKRSMVQAKLWTTAINRESLKDIRCKSSHGTQKPKGQSHSFGEGYKRTEKRNKVKNSYLKNRR